jgi:dihydroflavonol-4-reductase
MFAFLFFVTGILYALILALMNLVTGASGLLGSHVVLELLRRGEHVRAFCRKGNNLGIIKRLAEFYKLHGNVRMENLTWYNGDVLNVDDLYAAFEGVESVYHCAASVSYHRKDRKTMYQINIEGTANVVNTALLFPEIRLCHVSSIAALGRKQHMQTVKESDEWVDSSIHSHYAITKHLSENEVWRAMEEGLNAVIVNPSLIIGPGSKGQSSNAIFEHLLNEWNYFPVGGTGVIHAQDVAESMVALMKKGSLGERFTLNSENILYKDLWQKAAHRMKVRIPQKELPSWLPKLALIAEWLKEVFTGKKAHVTRESISNMELQFLYDSKKITKELGVTYRSMDEAVRDAINFMYP